MKMGKRLYLILAVVIGACGCGVVSPLRTGTTPGGSTTSGGKLYISTSGAILRYGSGLSATGNVAPDVTIAGASSQLNSPKRILLDAATDRLFVANQGSASVLIFSPASTATAGSSPSAVLTSTGNMTAPFDLAIDPSSNLLYVADGSNILVFGNESSLSGSMNVSPVRTVNFPFTIGGIFLSTSNNTMFIVDTADNAVDIMQSASTASGSGALLINGQIAGPGTSVSAPSAVILDSGGRPVISNGGSAPGILIFSNLVVPSGTTTGPAATISGSLTKIVAPGHMFFNPGANNGELYVVDTQAPGILIFTNINGLNGAITFAPARAIVGSGTGLSANAVNGVALDTTR